MHTAVNPDKIAAMLRGAGRQARAMPPSFVGAGVSPLFVSPEGVVLGRYLPGLGLALGVDLKQLGIRRGIRYVYQASKVGRALDAAQRTRQVIMPGSDDDAPIARSSRLGVPLGAAQVAMLNVAQAQHEAAHRLRDYGAVMADVTSYDTIISQRAAGYAEDRMFTKSAIAGTTVVAAWYSYFLAAGVPSAGAYTNNPGAVLTRADTGALSSLLTNPSSGKKKFLLAVGVGCFTQAHNYHWLIDQLIGCGNIALTAVTTVNITTMPALTRYTSGAGVLVMLDVTTALGVTTGAWTLNYTDQDGNTGNNTPTQNSAASSIVRSVLPNSGAVVPFCTLAAGDYGVRAVASVTISTAHTTNGIAAIVLYFPLLIIPGSATAGYMERDAALNIDGVVELVTASDIIGCLSLLSIPNTTTSGTLVGQMRTVASS